MRKPIPAPDRFWPKVQQTESCWVWLASVDGRGYSQFWPGPGASGPVKAYRFAYELLVGLVPNGHDLDHLCRNPRCVNPEHLQPVPSRTNTLRGIGPTAEHARKTHCLRGHVLPEPNARRERECKRCKAIRARAAYERKRARLSA